MYDPYEVHPRLLIGLRTSKVALNIVNTADFVYIHGQRSACPFQASHRSLAAWEEDFGRCHDRWIMSAIR
jgi:hypothetical protein